MFAKIVEVDGKQVLAQIEADDDREFIVRVSTEYEDDYEVITGIGYAVFEFDGTEKGYEEAREFLDMFDEDTARQCIEQIHENLDGEEWKYA